LTVLLVLVPCFSGQEGFLIFHCAVVRRVFRYVFFHFIASPGFAGPQSEDLMIPVKEGAELDNRP
jgi:hypothetical protein